MSSTDISERYLRFAEEAAGSSPLYATLARAVADDALLCESISALPERCHQPNLLFAAVQYVTGSAPASGTDLSARTSVHWDDISATMRSRYTQTNEANRCSALLFGLHDLPGPLAVVEVGASAGLCLQLDRYTYRYTGADLATLGTGPCPLTCELQPGARAPQRIPDIVWRAGLDQNPLDVTDQDDVRWLRSLVWPGMQTRLERLDSAIRVARTAPPRIDRGDLVQDLPALLDEVPEGTTPVVLHSAVLAYVDAGTVRDFLDVVEQAGAVRVGIESRKASPALADHAGSESANFTWGSFVLDRDGCVLAHCESYGSWLAPVES
ncbi:DUF2332 family protein [Allosaccharopolyspora coralli]|uniref:DUF2332 family protein n=1 Tax=Allosaccharopolyspora coralli TaxID=2665642 RepID=A0A5Q3QDB8_9PSEU|nr:DUF2332 domain-containing protein [Allosaccharopolyspora coralli]QGK71184.1 DUF2332 family protein [Allosaccharopolyspora coralli]